MAVELFINNEQLDTYADEAISITTKATDIKDVSKIFDDFSREFSVPASGLNNTILSRFPDSSIIEPPFGDPDYVYREYREKQRASIIVDGVLYKKGFMQYTKAVYEFGKLSHHVVNFTGALLSLNDILGDATLQDLNLLEYAHFVSAENVRLGMGYDTFLPMAPNNEIIYPLISNNKPLDGVLIEEGKLQPSDFRPAIKVQVIIDAITAFMIDVDPLLDVSFLLDPLLNLDALYLWMSVEPEPEPVVVSPDDLYLTYPEEPTFIDPDNRASVDLTTGVIHVKRTHYLDNVSFRCDVQVDPGETWGIQGQSSLTGSDLDIWKDIPTMAATGVGPNNNVGLYFDVVDQRSEFNPIQEHEYYRFKINRIVSTGTVVMQVGGRPVSAGVTDNYMILNFPLSSGAQGRNLAERLPPIKVIEFFSGILNVFHLVPQTDISGAKDYILSAYDNWLGFNSLGETNIRDLTEEVDITSHTIELPKVPKNIILKYEEPKAWKNKWLWLERTGVAYGDYIQPKVPVTGDTLEIEVPFENMAWNRGTAPFYVRYMFGHAFESNVDFTAVPQPIPIGEVKSIYDSAYLMIWDKSETGQVAINVEGFSAPVIKYKMCNSFDGPVPVNEQTTNTLNFSAAPDYFRDSLIRAGSYIVNYFPYMEQITNASARLHTYSAVIGIGKLSQITAATLIKIKRKWYFINSLVVDTLNLVSKLELVTYFRAADSNAVPNPELNPPTVPHPVFPVGNVAPTAPHTLSGTDLTDTTFILHWLASTSATGVIVKYEIQRYGVLWAIVTGNPAALEVLLTGLMEGVVGLWRVRGIDDEGLISDWSDTFTNAIYPTFVDPISLSSTEPDNVIVDWLGATAGSYPIDHYNIFIDNTHVGTVGAGVLTFTATGLDVGSHDVIVQVVDTEGLTDDSLPVNITSAEPPIFNGVLSITSTTGTSISISWSAATQGTNPLDKYVVYLDNVEVATLSNVTLNYTYTGLTDGQSYALKVVVVDTIGLLDESATINAVPTTLSPPTNLTATNQTFVGFDLSWTPPISGVTPTGYNIYKGGVLFATVGVVTTFTINTLDPGESATWNMRSTDGVNLSDLSSSITTGADQLSAVEVSTAGFEDSVDACNSNTGTQVLFHNGAGVFPVANDRIFTDGAGVNAFNGNKAYWKDKNDPRVYEIWTDGDVIEVVIC